MLNLIRNNSPYTVIILFIFTLVLKIQVLSHPQLPDTGTGHFLLTAIIQLCDHLFRHNAFAYTFLNVAMLFGQAIYLNGVAIKNKLLYKPTYIVAYLFIILTAIIPDYSYFNAMTLANWCIIIAVDFILSLHTTTQPRKHIFNLGYVLGIAALFHFQAITLLLLLLASIAFLRTFSLAEWLVSVLGYITPFYLCAGIMYLFDKEKVLLTWPRIGWALPNHIAHPFYFVTVLVCLVVMTLSGVYLLQGMIITGGIYVKRMWSAVAVLFFMSVIAALFTNVSEKSAWLLLMPALSLIIAPCLSVEKTKWFSNFAFYFSLLFVLICQLAA
ncbi:MAG: hypothetical protein JST82_15355 [Bacteroidetes bacterium]|nr:hypothetical protein [Bacteroidota bacterium]